MFPSNKQVPIRESFVFVNQEELEELQKRCLVFYERRWPKIVKAAVYGVKTKEFLWYRISTEANDEATLQRLQNFLAALRSVPN